MIVDAMLQSLVVNLSYKSTPQDTVPFKRECDES